MIEIDVYRIDRRIVIEDACPECGKHHVMPLLTPGGHPESSIAYCSVGTKRRVLDPGEYVLIEDVRGLPPEAWGVLNAAAAFGHPDGPEALWKDLCAALRADPLPTMAGGEQP